MNLYIYIYLYIYIHIYINAIMKTMSTLGYHHNDFMETHALGKDVRLPQSHYRDNRESTLFS